MTTNASLPPAWKAIARADISSSTPRVGWICPMPVGVSRAGSGGAISQPATPTFKAWSSCTARWTAPRRAAKYFAAYNRTRGFASSRQPATAMSTVSPQSNRSSACIAESLTNGIRLPQLPHQQRHTGALMQ